MRSELDAQPDTPVSGQRAPDHDPAALVLVRHGESEGNVAERRARERGVTTLDLEPRDADVGLSDDGRKQAEAVGSYLGGLDEQDRPTVVLSSPYRRALDTARTALDVAGHDLQLLVDERLRERDLGAFDGLTMRGIEETYPREAEYRGKVGKLYYRPPGGESWCDVALRVRSVVRDLREQYHGERVWVFSHQAVIMSFRLVLEHLSERELLDADRSRPVPNCSLTCYRRGGSGLLELVAYADTTAVDEAASAPRTAEPSASEPTDAAT
ncbi:MAG: histidine phosphatase family protein [Actinomycetes bacterium]